VVAANSARSPTCRPASFDPWVMCKPGMTTAGSALWFLLSVGKTERCQNLRDKLGAGDVGDDEVTRRLRRELAFGGPTARAGRNETNSRALPGLLDERSPALDARRGAATLTLRNRRSEVRILSGALHDLPACREIYASEPADRRLGWPRRGNAQGNTRRTLPGRCSRSAALRPRWARSPMRRPGRREPSGAGGGGVLVHRAKVWARRLLASVRSSAAGARPPLPRVTELTRVPRLW
jgi:hypothetical protein